MRTKRKYTRKHSIQQATSQSVPHNHLPVIFILSSNLLLSAAVILSAASGRHADLTLAAGSNQSSYLSSDYAVGPSALIGDEFDEPIESVVERAQRRRQVELEPLTPDGSYQAAGFKPLVASSNPAAFLDYDAYRPFSGVPFSGGQLGGPIFPPEQSYQRRALANGEPAGGGGGGGVSKPLISGGPAGSAAELQHSKMGPQFIKEPPSYINYLNSSDLVIPCSASGNPTPTITWWHKGAQLELGSLLDKRYVRYDNSLVIAALKTHEYEPDIHSTVYKCQASNSLGTIVSRDVVINAVIDPDLEVSVADQFVSVDNDAVFRCQLGAQTRHLFQVVGWLEDGQTLVQTTGAQLSWFGGRPAPLPPLGAGSGGGNQLQLPQQQRALFLPEGQLYIQRVQLKDANKSYRCQIKNLLSSIISLSPLSGRLFVTDASEQGGAAPRIVDAPKPITASKLNEQLLLTCLAQGFPRPQLRWFRLAAEPSSQPNAEWLEIWSGSSQQPANDTRYLVSQEGNLLLIKSVQAADNRARFRCMANNSYGNHQADTELRVELWPASKQVELEPRAEHINNADFQRQSLLFNCTIRTGTAPVLAIEWLKNGRPLFAIALAQFAGAPTSTGQPPHWTGSFADPFLHGANGNNSALLGLFDDPNQEASVIEYYLANSNQASSGANQLVAGDQLANSDPSNSDSATAEPASPTLDWLAGANNNINQDQAQQLVGQYLVSSSSLSKLSNSEPSEVVGQTTGRRVRQRVRLTSRDSLLYQLQIDQVRRSDRGSYQCRSRSTRTTLQATANLMLKDNPPQFVDAFASQLIVGASSQHDSLKSGQLAGQVSLRCVASGSPLPEISWTLSGFPVPEVSRFRVGDYVTRDGLIVSFVNISNVQAEDGGLYECSASNDVGQLRHAGWLNVTGPPYVRPMPNVNAVAGRSLSIMCPVGGHPIEQISWFQNSSKLPVNHRQKLFSNGTLLISDLNEASDAGQYWCQAKSANSDLVSLNHLQLSIKVPPLLEPFSFAKSLHRGQRYNIMCTVVRGDLPVSIRWFKDGRPLESALQAGSQPDLVEGGNLVAPSALNEAAGIAIKHLDPYSSTLTFSSLQAHHRGLYSCEAANEAGRANQSSALVIHIPPEWRIEPHDLSVTVGKTAVIDCQADGTPPARIEWRLSQDLFREPPSEFKPIISSLYMRVFENGSLIIYNTQRTDAGYYLCQASNGVGPGLSRVIKLTVHVAAHFKTKIRTELVRRGQAARLRCEAIGDLPIEINWLKDKMPLYGNEEPRYTLSRVNLQDGLVSELHLLETERSDSALFTCITQNQFGNDDTNIQLIVQAAPDPPLDIRIHEYEARSVKISWLAGHSGNSPISKYVIMYALTNDLAGQASNGQTTMQQQQMQMQHYANVSVAGNESSLALQGLTPLTEYQFYIVAINSIGSSRLANEPIKFRTDDEAPAGPPMFVKASGASSRAIKVRWRTPDRRAHYGSITGFYVGYRPHRPNTSLAANEQARDTFIYKTVELGTPSQSDSPGSMLTSATNRSASLQGSFEQECTLVALKRGQKYLITVQAFNGRGAGPSSEPVLAETWRIDVPDPPSLRMVLRTTHSIHLAWRPSGPAGASSALGNDQLPSAAGAGSASGNGQQQQRPLQQAASMARKTISDRMKAHNNQFSATSPSMSNDIDLSEPAPEQPKARGSLPEAEGDSELLAAQANEPILGYFLTRKQLQSATNTNEPGQTAGDSVEMRLPSDHLSQIIDNLQCGTRYQFNIAAINSVGVSAPSDPLVVKTEGSAPVAPDKSSLLSINASSSVLINLGAWHNGACAIRSFEVLFKASRSKKWTQLANYQVQQQQAASEPADFRSTAVPRQQPSDHQGAASSQRLVQQPAELGHSNAATNNKHLNGTTIVLDDLSAALNYDIKIVATNEAGTTEAIYTFSTGAGNGALSRAEQEWSSTGGEFQFSDVHLSELLFSNSLGQMLPWLLMLLVGSVALSMGCILAARRRHAASSSCSLSLSSASRSNQSSSNYYTADGVHHHQQRLQAPSQAPQAGRCNPANMGDPVDSAQGSPIAAGQKIIHLADIYGRQQANGHHLNLVEKSNYAYLGGLSPSHRASSPHNTDITSVINGSEVEMCLGASALNIHRREQEPSQAQHQHQSLGSADNQAAGSKRAGPHEQQVADEQAGFYVAPLLLQPAAKINQAAGQQMMSKSSTLPANCHQQIIQHLIQQHANNSANLEGQANQQHIMDTLMAANMLHCDQPDVCANQHANLLNGSTAVSASGANMASLLEQQLQQQVYATVKRGCPRPPRLCDYTIYQCPDPQQQQQQQQEQQLSMLRCCNNDMQQADQQAQVCYLPVQQACLQQQQQQQTRHQTSDYQQLRPIN